MNHRPLPWTCHRCATRHDTPELEARCHRGESQMRWVVAGIVIAIVLVVLAVDLARAQLAYGDWTCAFAECRRVVP